MLRLRGIRGRVCERRAWFAGMVVVWVTFAWNTWTRLWTLRLVCWDGCGVGYVCVEYVDAFVDTAPGLLGWLWCVFTYVWYA